MVLWCVWGVNGHGVKESAVGREGGRPTVLGVMHVACVRGAENVHAGNHAT